MIPGALPEQAEEESRTRSRLTRSLSIASDGTADMIGSALPMSNCMSACELPPVPATTSSHKVAHRKKASSREVHRIGTMPLTDLGRWKPQDDLMLVIAVQEVSSR